MSTASCPLCGETYLAAATVCADCRVALVLDPLDGAESVGPAGTTAEGVGAASADGSGGTGGLEVDDTRPGEVEPWPEGDDEIGYDLEDWGPVERDALTAALLSERVAHEWREDEVVVPERWADLTEELIDVIDHPDALDLDDGADDGGADLLGDLYVAADVLSGDPAASGAVIEVLELAPVVAARRAAPYGIDGETWASVTEQVGQLAGLLEADADEEEVQAVAGSLRSRLRPLV